MNFLMFQSGKFHHASLAVVRKACSIYICHIEFWGRKIN